MTFGAVTSYLNDCYMMLHDVTIISMSIIIQIQFVGTGGGCQILIFPTEELSGQQRVLNE